MNKQKVFISLLITCAGACTSHTDDTSEAESAVTRENGEFIIRVFPTGQVANIDPVLARGGSSLDTHAFFGVGDPSVGKGVTATSTLAELETYPTHAQDTFDTAAYYVPQVFWQGSDWHPGCTGNPPDESCGSAAGTYYARAYYTTDFGSATVQLPRMVMATGYPTATEDPSKTDPTSTERVYYTCGATPTVTTPNSKWPYDCEKFPNSQFDGVIMFADFPTCWNGSASGSVGGEQVVQYIDPHVQPGVTNDLAYINGETCPADFPLHIPHITFRLHTQIENPASDGSVIWPSSCAGSTFPPCPSPTGAACCQTQAASPTNIGIGLSTEDGGTPGGWFTYHAHYIQSWQMGNVTNQLSQDPPPAQGSAQAGMLNYLTQDCLDHPITCSFQPNGKGVYVGQ